MSSSKLANHQTRLIIKATLALFALLWWDLSIAQNSHEALTFRLENDVFTGSDSQYTNGLALTWSSVPLNEYKSRDVKRRWAGLFEFLPKFSAHGERDYLVLSLLHEMNTPTDITLADPPATDQPYSGVLLLGTTLYTNFPEGSQAWNIRLGVVGPVTRGDRIQSSFHELINADEPMGWDAQLPNEPLFNIGYMAGKPIARRSNPDSIDWRVVAMGSWDVGNYVTSIGGNVLLEFGAVSRRTLSNSSIGGSLPSIIGIGSNPTTQLEVTAYVGFGGYYLAHYLPLDGTLFSSSRSAEYSPLVLTMSLGATVRYQKLLVSIGATVGSTPLADDDPGIDYGGLSVGWVFD